MTCAMLPLSSTDSRGPSPSTCGRRPSVISQPGRPPVALTRLPPLSSLSLPGSPSAPSLSSFILDTGAGSPPLPPPIPPLLHPQPVRPVKVEHSPLLAGPSSPSLAQDSTRVAPADVYAHAYRLLRERWAGAGSEVKEAAEQAKEVLRAQDERKRRASLEQDEEEQERSAKRVKHRRASGMVAPVAEQVEFFDNAPPSLSSSTTTALDSAVNLVGIPRTTSLPPFATVFATELALLPQATTASPRTSPTLLKRKRSVSMPPPPLTVPAYARHPRTSLPSVTEPKPASTSLPPLSSVVSLVPLATLPTSRSLPSFPTPSSARSQALSQVVNLFEAARASRAEGFRRFGEGVEERRRKSMEGGSPRLPSVFERWQ
ncbi:hypothetical protein RTBOTA2_005324 [Rhodotorula toruloides]|uniref:Uncharacterized protein n=1 Tax=Rhodotorula toruloides TaxID=5286 RepID=A0A2T0A1Q0_RHOTO|nr:hypothetical protein RTBOTA2_005324 [Rhodotorula toruloides]PRQ71938.1 hypothetical protein AAT19DRAFT_10053 [Rhodotorula toruloides]